MRLLVVEDDADLRTLIARGLRNAGYATDEVASLDDALGALTTVRYDVVCLDLGLPDGDGIELCRRLNDDETLLRPHRILVLSARDGLHDRVGGLDAGADDYLVKPFDFAELLARLRALGRRGDQVAATLRVGSLMLDDARHSVTRDGSPVDLTPREFSLLRHLMRHHGQIVSTEQLLEHVWDANADPLTTSVRVILSRLRRKLGEPPMIETVPSVGYRLAEDR